MKLERDAVRGEYALKRFGVAGRVAEPLYGHVPNPFLRIDVLSDASVDVGEETAVFFTPSLPPLSFTPHLIIIIIIIFF